MKIGTKSAVVGGILWAAMVGGGLWYFFKKPTPPTQQEQKSDPVVVSCHDRKYTVVPADRARGLWGVAEKEYGGRGYLNLFIAEKSSKDYPSLVENPHLIKVGWVLTIGCCLCDLKPLPKKERVVPPTQVIRKRTVPPSKPPCPVCPTVEAPKPAAAPAPVPVAETPAPVVVTPVPAPAPVSVVQPPAPPPAPVLAVEPPKPAPVVVHPVPAPAPAPVVQTQPDLELVPPEAQSNYEAPVTRSTPPSQPTPPPSSIKKETEHRGRDEGKAEKKPDGGSAKATPGSLWNVAGMTPIERGNPINYFHFDQGVVWGRYRGIQFTPYIALNATKDGKGLLRPWNNKAQVEGGIRAVVNIPGGIVEVGTAYSAERRFSRNAPRAETRTGLINYVGFWKGWNLPKRSPATAFFPGEYPGSFQGQAGNTSAFERYNVIGNLRLEQGFTLLKFKGISFIPTGVVHATADTDKNPWNRRFSLEAVTRAAVPFGKGILDFRGGVGCAQQYSGQPLFGTSRRSCGPVVGVTFWTGWGRR